jgi:hypothetical protein
MAAFFGLASAQSTDIPVTGILGNASVVENNPPGVIYTATLPTTEFFNPEDPRGNIKGAISAVANSNGIGVAFSVDFSNFPTSGGPFCMLPQNNTVQWLKLIIHQCTTFTLSLLPLMATVPTPWAILTHLSVAR